MDTTATNIKFDENGTCSYCLNYNEKIKPYLKNKSKESSYWFGNLKLQLKRDSLKTNFDYDCVIGLSGGVDSSYLVYYAVKYLKIKPLIFHVDTGWNNKVAVSNIEKLIDKFDLDLHTEVIDWNEMKDLTLSLLLAQVPTIDIVQDHAIWASMYNFSKKNNVKNILTGGNLHTESVREPLEWAYHATDLTHIKDIHKKFGKIKLEKFPTCDILTYQLIYKYLYYIKIHQPLNYIKYNKKEAIEELTKEIGWSDYGGKHHESNFTKFIEGYWMPEKFGYDKRKVHLSSLIHTNQILRETAITEIKKKSYNDSEIEKDFKYIASKLGLTYEELKIIFNQKNKSYTNYKSKDFLLRIAIFIKRHLGSEKRLFI
jgi:N-acetyl sugar amidotransferase